MQLSLASEYKGSVTIFLAVVLFVGCHRVKEPFSRIDVADVRSGEQLLSGFYQIENGTWRWTARQFSAALRPPEGAEQRGATLQLQFYIPESQIESLGPVTLSANTEGYILDPETFSKGGSYIYSRKIPVDALATSLLPVKFSFDKAIAPIAGDGRELGAIVSRIELQTD